MISYRVVMASPRSGPRGRTTVDDLGFPIADDPSAFARAFVAVRSDLVLAKMSREPSDDKDDLGLVVESDPADFACAFDVTWGRV